MRGRKYFAVVTSATRRRPRLSPFRSSMAASKRPQTSSSARAVRSISSPAAVRRWPPAFLLEKRQAQGIDDLPDLQRNGRLCQVQGFSGFRKAAVVRNRREGLELAKSDAAARHI
jgi:hypothetical protein